MYLDCIGLSLNMTMSWHVAGCKTEVVRPEKFQILK